MADDVIDGLSSSLAVRLRQAEAAIGERLAPLLAEHDLTMEQWRIVAVIDDQPGRTMSSVAAAAVVPAATLTRHMDKLVERGIVVRHVDPHDKRRVIVALSPEGRLLSERLRDLERQARHPVLDHPAKRTHVMPNSPDPRPPSRASAPRDIHTTSPPEFPPG